MASTIQNRCPKWPGTILNLCYKNRLYVHIFAIFHRIELIFFVISYGLCGDFKAKKIQPSLSSKKVVSQNGPRPLWDTYFG